MCLVEGGWISNTSFSVPLMPSSLRIQTKDLNGDNPWSISTTVSSYHWKWFFFFFFFNQNWEPDFYRGAYETFTFENLVLFSCSFISKSFIHKGKFFLKCHDNTGIQLPKISLGYSVSFTWLLKFLISLKFANIISSPIRAAMPIGKDHGD